MSLFDVLTNDELVLRAARRTGPLRCVEDVLGEQRLFAAAFAADTEPDDRGESLANALVTMPAYLWLNDIRKLAINTPCPPHVIDVKSLVPFDLCYWTFETAMSTPRTSHTAAAIPGDIDAMIVQRVGDTVSLAGIFVNDSGKPRLTEPVEIRTGHIYPTADENTNHAINMLSFLSAPFAVRSVERMNRAYRKRQKVGDLPDTVTFIRLRSIIDKGPRLPIDGGTVEWNYRWLVRAHRRAQWCPSTKSHRLIWVDSYIKGPDDKPLKPAVYAVVR